MGVTLAVLLAALCCRSLADITWHFDDPAEVTGTSNLRPFLVADGEAMGQTAWDPYLGLRLPEGGLDVANLPYLTVRMYSSADADVLDVYYHCADGRWGLGRTLPVKRGWAVYRADLRQAGWTESGMPEDARQWGGVTKHIISFRIDPGNEADRWVVVDSVTLSAEPGGPLGVTAEPRGRAIGATLRASAEVLAGEPIRAAFSCDAALPPALTEGRMLIRLLSHGRVAKAQQQKVLLSAGRLTASAEFPVSRWAPSAEFTLCAEVLELDGEPAQPVVVHVVNPRQGQAKPPETQVADYHGEPALYINGQPTPLIMSVHYGAPPGPLHAEMAGAGIRIYSDWFGASTAGDLGHIKPDVYDYSAYDEYFAAVLDAVPDAYFLPHVGVVAPQWWQQLHPEECCLFSNGQRGPSSMASELWKTEMAEDLRRLIAHLQSAPYADRILGYIFFSGFTAEWQMWATWTPHSDDFSEPAVRAFRQWLKRKYGSDRELRKAWNDPRLSLDTAEVPSHEQRTAPGPFLRDPALDRQVIDYSQAASDMVADAIIHFARVVKEATSGKQVAGTYYGYMAAHGARQPWCGHNALARILDCPDVDFLMSPNMYAFRNLGETSTLMSATESVKLHGKLWIDEADLRTYLSDPSSGYGRTETAEQSVAVMWREFANVLTRHVAVSWFDMGGGWFSGKPLLDMFAAQVPIAQAAFQQRQPFHGDVAVFVDERSAAYFRSSDLYFALVEDTVSRLPQSGVTWDFYLLSDIVRPDLPSYRLYVLLNAVHYDADLHRALMTRLEQGGGTLLLMYLPGYATEQGLDASRLWAMTGMTAEMQPAGGPAAYRVGPSLLTGPLSPDVQIGPASQLAPRAAITDQEAQIAGRFTDGPGALARKTHRGVSVVWCSSVHLPPELLREIARVAGAHIYCESNDALYTDGYFVGLHAGSGGEKIIRLPSPRRVVDVISGECLAEQTTMIRREMEMGQTLLVRLE